MLVQRNHTFFMHTNLQAVVFMFKHIWLNWFMLLTNDVILVCEIAECMESDVERRTPEQSQSLQKADGKITLPADGSTLGVPRASLLSTKTFYTSRKIQKPSRYAN